MVNCALWRMWSPSARSHAVPASVAPVCGRCFAIPLTGRLRKARQPIRKGNGVGSHTSKRGWSPGSGPRAQNAGSPRVAESPARASDTRGGRLCGTWPRARDPGVQRLAALQQEQQKRAAAGYPQLDRGRANLALRNWPNCAKAHAVLAAQEYLPVLEGRLLTRRGGPP